MTFVDDRPDLRVQALQALHDDFLYFNVAGSGPTFPVAQRAAERYRAWLNGVAMFSHVGYDSYNAELAATREALASFVGGDAGRIALMQSATQAILVHQALGPTVGERLRSLRERLLHALSGLPLDLLGRAAEPTGIVVVRPRGGDAAGIVRRLWDDERIVVKLIDESDAIRISFWALHDEPDIDRLAGALATQLAVRA